MTDLRKAAEMALKFCEDIGELSGPYPYVDGTTIVGDSRKVSKALRQALAQPEQEPVAWFIQYEYRHEFLWRKPNELEQKTALEIKPLYAAPVDAVNISQECVDETVKNRHKWVGLTEDEISAFEKKYVFGSDEFDNCFGYWAVYRAIEAKLKEKNG